MSLSLSHPKRVLAAPSLFGRILGLALLYSSWSFKPWFFFLCPKTDKSAHSPSVLSLPTAIHSVGVGGVPFITLSLSLLLFLFAILITFYCEAVQPVLCSSSGRNCSKNRCHWVCSVGHHFGLEPQTLLFICVY